jgi:hypothetical protein
MRAHDGLQPLRRRRGRGVTSAGRWTLDRRRPHRARPAAAGAGRDEAPGIGPLQGAYREGILTFLRHASALNLLSTPIVYSVGLPLLLLDAWVPLYQWICFPMYGIARVRRHEHFVVDRHRLPYLNPIEKLHCFLCSYATGVLSYVREITARTEQYWCPITHATPIPAPHEHYRLFVGYGDAAAYRHGLRRLRRQLARLPARAGTNRDEGPAAE